MLRNQTPTFLLQDWRVQRRDDGWYVARPTSRFEDSPPRWRGPYSSATSASLVIARELKKEMLRRSQRFAGT
jgi:hypothetical protein